MFLYEEFWHGADVRFINELRSSVAELSTGPFCVTRSHPTNQLTDPTQPNSLQVEKFGPNPTQPMGQPNPWTTLVGGHYQCVVERQYDRLFALSTVAVTGRMTPLPQIPQLELNTCRQSTYNRSQPGPILSLFPALIVHSELKSVHPGFPVAFIFKHKLINT